MSGNLIYNSGRVPDGCVYNSGRAPNPAAGHRAMLRQCAAVLDGREPDLIKMPGHLPFAEWTKRRRLHQNRHNAARAGGRPSPLEAIQVIAAYEELEGIRRGAAARAARHFGKTRDSISILQKVAEGWRTVLNLDREYCLAVLQGGDENIPGELKVLPDVFAEIERLLGEFEPSLIRIGQLSLPGDVGGEKRRLKIQTPYKGPRPR